MSEIINHLHLIKNPSFLHGMVPHQYKLCNKKCDSCDNFLSSQSYVTFNATRRNYYIRRNSTFFAPNFVYMPHHKQYKKQSVGSTILWKPRLRKYKIHFKKNARSCTIATLMNFDKCCDEEIPFKYLAFITIDVFHNTSGLTHNRAGYLLLEKENFWTGILEKQHRRLNSTHDCNHSKQTEKKEN